MRETHFIEKKERPSGLVVVDYTPCCRRGVSLPLDQASAKIRCRRCWKRWIVRYVFGGLTGKATWEPVVVQETK